MYSGLGQADCELVMDKKDTWAWVALLYSAVSVNLLSIGIDRSRIARGNVGRVSVKTAKPLQGSQATLVVAIMTIQYPADLSEESAQMQEAEAEKVLGPLWCFQ